MSLFSDLITDVRTTLEVPASQLAELKSKFSVTLKSHHASQSKAGKARWTGTNKEDRAAAMKAIALRRWSKNYDSRTNQSGQT